MSDRRHLLIFPAIILLLFNSIFPTVVVLNYSFTKPFSYNPVFEGTNNYEDVLHSNEWWDAFKRNALFTGIVLAIEVPVGLLFALLIRGKGQLIDYIGHSIVYPTIFASMGWAAISNGAPQIALLLSGIAGSLFLAGWLAERNLIVIARDSDPQDDAGQMSFRSVIKQHPVRHIAAVLAENWMIINSTIIAILLSAHLLWVCSFAAFTAIGSVERFIFSVSRLD